MSLGSTAGGRITAGVGANLIGQHAHDRNQEATVYVGNLDPQVRFHEGFMLFHIYT
jgi:splicing factor 3B subunit 4